MNKQDRILREEFADLIAEVFNKNPNMWKLLDEYEDKQKFWSRQQ